MEMAMLATEMMAVAMVVAMTEMAAVVKAAARAAAAKGVAAATAMVLMGLAAAMVAADRSSSRPMQHQNSHSRRECTNTGMFWRAPNSSRGCTCC